MAFVVGPRQVGKTTLCRELVPGCHYLNWDDEDDRAVISRGTAAVAARIGLEQLRAEPAVLVLDELHKFRRWRTFLKGLFDRHADRLRIVVTGSSRLDFYRKGGDSLMGRYFPYRLHPLTVGELVNPMPREQLLREPAPIAPDDWRRLLEHGGFPEPFVRDDRRFSSRWQRLRQEQLVRGDVRDLTRIQEIDQLALLVRLLASRSASQVNYSAFANEIRTSVDTMRRWFDALCSLYHGFLLRPWFRNVARSLRKEPKWYLRDWSTIDDAGARAETFVACHLFKAVQSWEDAGLGTFALHYLRDKDRREVDFLVVRDDAPWFLVEVKARDEQLSPSLLHFQAQTGAAHAFQVVVDAEFVDADPFARGEPCVVPARTLLSQLT
ncbi:MAG: ATP-binding protein [Planctomycetes bacterium]|nr:ATP-binding protein [Planctomycetota bacterium]